MESAVQVLGYAPLSWGACLTELSIPVLLIFKRTRLYAAFLALGLHGFIHSTILVSTFGVTMLVLLGAFLPTPEEQKGRGGVTRGAVALAMGLAVTSPLAARLASTGVGSYTMFTKLSFYELEMRLDGQIFPRRRLAPHLGRDGARIVRLANGRGIGETNLEILGRALPELARFLCALEPETDRVQLKLTSRRIEGGTGSRQLATHNCSRH
jgi:hypothetical protein